MTESTDAPDPGEIGQCVDGDWLERCEAWINGITCKDAPNPDLPSVCDIDLNSAGGIEGYDQTFSAQEGTIHIEFEAYGVPDQLIISTDTGTLLDTGMMSGHLSRDIAIPIGISSLRIQVIGSSSGTAWTLQVSCVEDDGFPSADCFTGVYDLGSVSFPMNKWADGDYRGSNGYLYWSYENSRWQMGNGYGDGVIYVGPSTKSNPVGFYPGGFMDSYHVTGPC
jgi:hypothetical protein